MFNLDQLEIIKTKASFAYINAGAGTGKTTTIVGRINYLIKEGISPSKILSISFTNKAVSSLKEKINNKDVKATTFHKLILDFISEDESVKIFENNELFSKKDLAKISRYKNLQTKIKPYIYGKYEKFLSDFNYLDFDDIFIKFLNSKRNLDYEYIFVDEFQDTNLLQYKVLKKIISEKTKVMAVGDFKQSIYMFRGSDFKIINKFINDYNAKVYYLKINYRSCENLVRFSNNIIKPLFFKNEFKALIPYKQTDGTISIKTFQNGELEAKNVVFTIKKLLNAGIRKKDIAIFAREEKRLFCIKKELSNSYLDISSNGNKISLLTIHKSKGLEFKEVFLIGLENGIFPKNKENTFKKYLEEKRLFYVAITRSMEYLFLSRAKVVDNIYRKPSPFYIRSRLNL